MPPVLVEFHDYQGRDGLSRTKKLKVCQRLMIRLTIRDCGIEVFEDVENASQLGKSQVIEIIDVLGRALGRMSKPIEAVNVLLDVDQRATRFRIN